MARFCFVVILAVLMCSSLHADSVEKEVCKNGWATHVSTIPTGSKNAGLKITRCFKVFQPSKINAEITNCNLKEACKTLFPEEPRVVPPGFIEYHRDKSFVVSQFTVGRVYMGTALRCDRADHVIENYHNVDGYPLDPAFLTNCTIDDTLGKETMVTLSRTDVNHKNVDGICTDFNEKNDTAQIMCSYTIDKQGYADDVPTAEIPDVDPNVQVAPQEDEYDDYTDSAALTTLNLGVILFTAAFFLNP